MTRAEYYNLVRSRRPLKLPLQCSAERLRCKIDVPFAGLPLLGDPCACRTVRVVVVGRSRIVPWRRIRRRGEYLATNSYSKVPTEEER